jgi:hypothetical protein
MRHHQKRRPGAAAIAREMRQEEPVYRSFLLRLWQAPGRRSAAWRIVLESANGEWQTFASLEALCAYLQAEAKKNGADAPERYPDRVSGGEGL